MASMQHLRPRRLIGLVCLVAAVACRPMPSPAPTLNLRIVAVPSLMPLAQRLAQEHANREPHLQVQAVEASQGEALEALQTGQADVALLEHEPEPEEILSAETRQRCLRVGAIGYDVVAVVVNLSNPVHDLSLDQLRAIYAGLETRWDSLGGPDVPIQIVAREAGAAARLVLDRVVLAPDHLSGKAILLPSDRAIAEYVSEHPGAIGYLSMAWVDARVQVVSLAGIRPGAGSVSSGRYPLAHPIVLVTHIGPAGKVHAFVAFTLSRDGQAILAERHAPLGR